MIRKKYGVYLGPSTVYPALAELEKQGLIQSIWDTDSERPRKVYVITNKGGVLLGQTTTVLELVNRKVMVEVKA